MVIIEDGDIKDILHSSAKKTDSLPQNHIKIFLPIIFSVAATFFFLCRRCFRKNIKKCSEDSGYVSRTNSITDNDIVDGNIAEHLARTESIRTHWDIQRNPEEHVRLINIRVHLLVSTDRSDSYINSQDSCNEILRNMNSIPRTSDETFHTVTPVCETSSDGLPTYSAVVLSDFSEQGPRFPVVPRQQSLESPPPNYDEQKMNNSNG